MPKNRNASDYAQLGAKIAEQFLLSNVPLTDSLSKVAKEEDLNTYQIQRVAECANQRVFKEKFEKRAGGDVQFEPARSDVVIRSLNAPEKIAFDMSDYYERPEKPQLSKAAMDQMVLTHFGEDLSPLLPELEKMASLEEQHQAPVLGAVTSLEEFEKAAAVDTRPPSFDLPNLLPMIDKLAAAKREFELEKIEIAKMAREEEENFTSIVREMVRDGYKIEDLYKAATVARPDQKDALTQLFARVTSDLHKVGALTGFKTAAPVDTSFVSEKLKNSIPGGLIVVNGIHPLTVSVNVLSRLKEQWTEADAGEQLAVQALGQANKIRAQKAKADLPGAVQQVIRGLTLKGDITASAE